MASFPGPKVHRFNRRRLGRGQFPAAVGVTVVVSTTGGTNVTLTFSRPVVVTGNIPFELTGSSISSQTIVSPTVVSLGMVTTVTGRSYTLAAGAANVASYQGGPITGAAGAFA